MISAEHRTKAPLVHLQGFISTLSIQKSSEVFQLCFDSPQLDHDCRLNTSVFLVGNKNWW
jgi:hypothetical protein